MHALQVGPTGRPCRCMILPAVEPFVLLLQPNGKALCYNTPAVLNLLSETQGQFTNCVSRPRATNVNCATENCPNWSVCIFISLKVKNSLCSLTTRLMAADQWGPHVENRCITRCYFTFQVRYTINRVRCSDWLRLSDGDKPYIGNFYLVSTPRKFKDSPQEHAMKESFGIWVGRRITHRCIVMHAYRPIMW